MEERYDLHNLRVLQQEDSKKGYFREASPNSVILVPTERSELLLKCFLEQNKHALHNPRSHFLSLIRFFKDGEMTSEYLKIIKDLSKKVRYVTTDPDTYLSPENYFLRYPHRKKFSLVYSDPLVYDLFLRLNGTFDFPKHTRKTDTIIPGYVEEKVNFIPEIILADAPIATREKIILFKEPLTLELLTTF